ncbi:hypothetical protein [Flavobacterium sp.]|uniref:hypothetical protein n=1 Tax=Flavobacterium sp. TaxID=239 RepID=UPI00374FF33F
MNKFLSFFKTPSSLILVLISFGIGVLAKLIEKKFPDVAMGLQLITFILFVYGIVKYFNSRFK